MFWQTAVYTFIVMFTWIQLLYSHHDSEDKLLSSSVFFVIPNKPSLVSGSEAAKLESEVSRENAALRYLAICVPQVKDTWKSAWGDLVLLVAHGAVHERAGAVGVWGVLELSLMGLGVVFLTLLFLLWAVG